MAQATATVKTKPNMGTARTGRTIEETAAQQASLIRKRMEDAGKQTDRFKEITAQMAAAVKSGDLDKVRSLTTTFADVRASFVANSKDLASAMFGLGAEFKEIGVLIEELQALSPEEQKLINDAEALQKRMEGRLSNANAELAKAENKTAIFGFRRRAVEAAHASIARSQEGLGATKAGVAAARQMAEQQQRQRLQSLDMEQSMQKLQMITQQIIDIARERIDGIKENLEAVQQGGIATMADLKQLATEVEERGKELAAANAELETLREQLAEQAQGSAAATAVQEQIRNKERARDDILTGRNKAYALSQEGARYTEMYRAQESSQRDLLQFHETWIAILDEGIKNRSVVYKSYIDVMKDSADQQAMSSVDQLARETDLRITNDTAQVGAALQKNILERLEAHPGEVRALRDIIQAMAESNARFDSRFDALLDKFRKNYGTDPFYDDRTHQPVNGENAAA